MKHVDILELPDELRIVYRIVAEARYILILAIVAAVSSRPSEASGGTPIANT